MSVKRVGIISPFGQFSPTCSFTPGSMGAMWVDISTENWRGQSPLHGAAASGQHQVIQELLKDPRMEINKGDSRGTSVSSLVQVRKSKLQRNQINK